MLAFLHDNKLYENIFFLTVQFSYFTLCAYVQQLGQCYAFGCVSLCIVYVAKKTGCLGPYRLKPPSK